MKKDFEEIYTEIYEECVKDLKSVRNKLGKFVFGILLVLIVINIIIGIVADYKSLLTISISLSILVLLIFLKNAHKIYSQKYKDMVIGSLVKKYNQGLSFDSKSGLAVIDYRMSNFDNTFKEYYSEDRIYGTLEDGTAIQSSEITTYDVSHYVDSNGENKTSQTQTFRGYYGVVKLSKNPALEITILDDNFTKKYSRKRVEVDSSEFEKFYDCITNNRVEAMEIFTSDLIEKYVDIASINDCQFELKIVNNKIYFRYECGQMFEPPTFKNDLDEKIIRQYYMLIFYPMEVLDKTIESIYSLLDI